MVDEKDLMREIETISKKYSAIRDTFGEKISEIEEELNTAHKIEVALAIIEILGLKCTLKDWIDMTNSLVMTGTLINSPPKDIEPEIRVILSKYLQGQITKEEAMEEATLLAMENGMETSVVHEEIQPRLEEIEKKLPRLGFIKDKSEEE